jgi:hypothetical protein
MPLAPIPSSLRVITDDRASARHYRARWGVAHDKTKIGIDRIHRGGGHCGRNTRRDSMSLFARSGLCGALFAVTVCASATHPWITASEYDELHIVLSPHAPKADILAAELFRDHWLRYTGHLPAIGHEPVRDAINVWIGRAGNPFAERLGLERLGDDGFLVQTLDLSWRKRIRDHFGVQRSLRYQKRKHLIVAGGEETGAVPAVDYFFRYYVASTTAEPPKSIPAVTYRYPATEPRPLGPRRGHWQGRAAGR